MSAEYDKIAHSIKLLEGQRHILGNNFVDEALAKLKQHLLELDPTSIIKWPLFAAYVIQERYGEVIHQLKDLLLPYQIKIKQEVEDVINKAINHWDNNEAEAAQIEINKVFILAQKNHYF